jgi:AraC family transcriptional regulator
MTTEKRIAQVSIVDFNETKVAVFEHRGDPRRIDDSVRSFIAWRKQNHLPPKVSATYNILYDTADEVAPDDFRLDICAATEQAIADNAFGVVGKTIPAGRCAVLRHIGSDDNLGDAIAFLCTEWLPQSGEDPRDFPIYLQRVKFFPDVPEHEATIDVFLPIK